MFKKALACLFLLVIILVSKPAFALDNSAQAVISAYLPTILSVDNIVIDGKKVSTSEKNPVLSINNIKKATNNSNILELSSLQLDIKSNSGELKTVTAEFTSLKSSQYSFPSANLEITPKKVEFRGSAITPAFMPSVKVSSAVKPGMYDGVIVFTVAGR